MDDTLARVADRVAERFPADLERIRDYLRMPSVSATGEGIGAVAEATGAWIEGAGGSFELVATPGHPLVLGELPGPAGAPRLLRYGMYDVQPAQEPEWTSPPFAAEVRDLPGVGPAVVARGSANSKSCLACFFLAVEVLRELDAMPLTVALMIEGEEELGSPNLAAAVRARAGDLTAEGAFDLDLTAGLDGQPELILGCKGLCDLELVAEAGDWGGPAIDLHSSEQAWIASPVWALVQALATLTGPDEEIRVAGLDGGPGPGDGDRRLLAELAAGFDPAEHLREANAARYRLAGGPAELLEALLFRPTMNISGLAAGYVGPGGKTIVPSRAVARVDIRLVGGDPEAAAAAVRRHLADHGFGHVQVNLLDAYPWAKAPPGQPLRAGHARLLPGHGPDHPALPAGPLVRPLLRVRPHPRAALGVGRGRPRRRRPRARRVRHPGRPPGAHRRRRRLPARLRGPAQASPEGFGEPQGGAPVSPVRVVVARGDPLERGRTVGWELADLIRSSLEFYWRYLVRRGVGAGELPGLLAPYLAAAERELPDLVELVTGMAEGAGVSFWELFCVNAFEELEPLLEARSGPRVPRGGMAGERCSTVTISGPGYTLLGHNEQWLAGDARARGRGGGAARRRPGAGLPHPGLLPAGRRA